MKRILAGLLTFLTVGLAIGADIPTLPFRDVRSGMKGSGRTVFSGNRIESFEVEILGTLPRIGPEQDLILARLSGGPLAETGVLAGMSGSPVFIDGKLIGAVAYSWGFAKDAIAGITPIEEMLAVSTRGEKGEARARTGAGSAAFDLSRLRSATSLASFFSTELPRRIAAPTALRPISVPVSVSGLGALGASSVFPDLFGSGFLPAQGGGGGADKGAPENLEPGSAIGLKLVRGDIDMTATGTVTWVDGDRVLAFGHPLFGLGAVLFPLTGARVEALLPSLDRSLRLATPLRELGSFVEDRNAAVLGRLGRVPRMVPVRLLMSFGGKEEKSYSFDLAEDPLLTPLLLYDSLNGILASRERVFGNVTLRVREGSVIRLAGQSDVELQNLFAGSTAPQFATGTSAFLLYMLMNNDLVPPRVDGVNLILDYDAEPRTARVRRVTLDRFRIRPGEELEVRVVLSPFRGEDRVLTRTIRIPSDTPTGPLVLNVGDALAMARTEGMDTPLFPRDLAQLISLMNRVPRNDRVYLVASRDDAGAFLDGSRLPNLPPSVNTVLARPRSRGNFGVIPQRSILEEQIPVDYSVDGLARVELEVEAP